MMNTETRKGRQTPTRSLVLPYERTKGKEAIDIYAKTGRTAQEWQQLLLYDILSFNDEGLWVHTKFGYSVPRRNGTNEIVAMRELWGLFNDEQILHTAHRTTTSHSAWERLCRLLDKACVAYKSIRATGRELITLENGEGRIEFRTRSSKGGLGEGFDLLVIDEAQEYQDDQESALKYVVTDSQNPQTLFCGTPPTPVSSGTVFTKLRRAALHGQTVNTGWAEWSVEFKTDPHDKDAWYETNPSLGTIFTERSVADEIGNDDVDFNIQRLGLWLKYNQKSAISQVEWNELRVKALPSFVGKLFVGIKFGKDGRHVSMSIAVKTVEEKIFIETIDCRPASSGFQWILDFLSKADIKTVVIDGANGQQLLSDAMKQEKMKSPKLPTVKEVIAANAAFEQAVFQKKVCHAGQPSLVQVVSNCEKRAIGSSGGFGYKSILEESEIALMESAIFAYWACSSDKGKKKQQVGY